MFVLVLAAFTAASLQVGAQSATGREARGGRAAAPARAVAPRSAAKDPFASEPLVVERMDTVYRYNADGTGTKLETQTARAQDDAGVRSLGVLNFPYASARERVEIVYVRVRKPGGAVVQTPAADAQDTMAPVTQAAPQYSDLHVLRLGVRGLAAGDVLEYQVRTVFTVAWPKAMFWGGEREPGRGRVVLERSVELHVPASRSVRVSVSGHPTQASDEGGEKVYRWSGSQLKPTVLGRGRASADGAERDDSRPVFGWTTFPDWAAVGEWYREQAADGAGPETSSVKAKADSVIYGAKTPEAKLRALYDFVSAEVRSIDVPLGTGRYGAALPGEVLGNLYGDSQDKNALLAAMLRSEGFAAETAMVSAADGVDADLPLPGWFSRVVTVVQGGAHGDVWLDPMPEIAPMGMLEPSLRDKQALVIPSAGSSKLERTPLDLPFAESAKFEAVGSLDAQGALQAHVDLHLRGDQELTYREELRAAGPARWDRVVEYLAHNAGLAGQPSNTVSDSAEAADGPLHLSYDYTASPYGDWENFRIVPLEPTLALPFTDRSSAPEADIVLGGKRTETAVSRLTLPAGFGADLPGAVHVDAPFATLDKTYRLENTAGAQVLVTDRTLTIKQNRLPASDWPAYSKFLEGAGRSEPWIQLTSTVAHTGPGHFPPMAGEDSPAAAQLVQEAAEAAHKGGWASAAAALDRAKAINPRQALLWSGYADVAMHAGKQDEAALDLHEELKGHAAEGHVSRRLAALLIRSGREAEATTVLVAAVRANPQDVESTRMLAGLEAKTNPVTAEKTLRTGLGAVPDSMPLKLALADVLLHVGKRDEAGALLTAVANASDDAALLNDTAYALADAGLNLRLAELTAHRALEFLNGAALRGGNNATGVEALRQTAQLVACWDTYGWVLYKEGSYSEAEAWLRAAWTDGLGADAGRHYAQLLTKQGRGAEASHVLSLASRAGSGDAGEMSAEGSSTGPKDTGLRSTRVRGTAGPRNAAVVGGAGPEPERMYALAQQAGRVTGSAVFDLDYSLTVPTAARFVRGNADLEGLGDALAHLRTQTFLPPGSVAHLVRRAVVTCGAGASCSVRLLSSREAVAQ